MENNRKDYCEKAEGVEERLAEASRLDRLTVERRKPGPAGRYRTVDEYDAVLRAHCRLDEVPMKKA